MPFDLAVPFVAFDPTVPVLGSVVSAPEIRAQLSHIATHARGSQEPVTPGQIRGDARSYPVNLTGAFNLKLKIDALAYVTVNMGTGGASPLTARTLADIVGAINTQLNAAYSTATTYAYAADGWLVVRSQSTNPAVSAVTIDNAASNDGKEKVFAFALSGITSFPYTRTGSTPASGRTWLSIPAAFPHVGQSVRLRVDRPARLLGRNPDELDTTIQRWIRLTVNGVTNEIDVGSTAADRGSTTIAEAAAAINAAFAPTVVAYDTGDGLLLQSPSTGSGQSVALNRPTGASGWEDATQALMRLSTGSAPRTYDLYPISDTGVGWADTWVRSAEDRPGIGLWGPPAASLQSLSGTSGIARGDVRLPLDTLLPVAWNDKTASYQPMLPAAGPHVAYDPAVNILALRVARVSWYGVDTPAKKLLTDAVASGDVPILRDTRDEAYPSVTSAGISLARAHDAVDNFQRSDATSLGTASSGDPWTQLASAGDGWRIASSRAAFDGTPGGTDFAIIDEAFTAHTLTVAARLSKASGVSMDTNPCAVGLVIRAADTANLYYVRVEERGNIVLVRRTASVDTTLQTWTAKADPLLSPAGTTLRVVVQPDNLVRVYWGGSIDPTDWASTYEERFAVGTFTLPTPQAGNKTGIYGLVVNASGKEVYVADFIARSAAAGSEPLVGLPPVPGHQLRHIVAAVRAPDKLGGSTEIITDARPNAPLLLTGKAGSEHYGIDVEQDTANRTVRFKIGGAGVQQMMFGLDIYCGDTAGTKLGQYARQRINVGPGMAVVPTPGGGFELRALNALSTISLASGDTSYKTPAEGGSPQAGRFYYLYIAADGAGAEIEYSLTAPNYLGIASVSGRTMRFIGSFYWGTDKDGVMSVRQFYRDAGLVRYVVPNGYIGSGGIGGSYVIFSAKSGSNADYNLRDTGAAALGLVPKTARLCRIFGITGASSGTPQTRFSTSANQGFEGQLGIDKDNDGEYSLVVSPDGILRVGWDGGVDTSKAGVIGYYEDPLRLPAWLGA
ncbi:MAG: hypothetical protein IPH13_21640 [Planctomycetes bacterium]|nr:hypothetical protein [Planctomycetota bacterium]